MDGYLNFFVVFLCCGLALIQIIEYKARILDMDDWEYIVHVISRFSKKLKLKLWDWTTQK